MPERVISVGQGDCLALGLVAVEQRASAPALDDRGELPADVNGVRDAGVHPIAAGGYELVRRVSGEEDPPFAEAVSYEDVGSPDAGLKQRVDLDLTAEGLLHAPHGIEVGQAGRR